MLNFNFFCLDTKEAKNQGFGCLGEKGISPSLKIPKLAVAQTVGIFHARVFAFLSHASKANADRKSEL